MLSSPFRSPYQLIITQEFGNTSNNAWYQSMGVNFPFHNGIDIVFGNSKQTYGTECICPFDTAKVVKVTWDSPLSAKGNGVTIEGDYEGKKYQVVFWHTGEITCKIGQILKKGDVVCYIGNSGLCNPAPNVTYPWAGAHCHLMIFVYKWVVKTNGTQWVMENYDNGVYGAQNPRLLFDFTKYEKGNDTGLEHDAWALQPYLNILTGSQIVKYLRDILKI